MVCVFFFGGFVLEYGWNVGIRRGVLKKTGQRISYRKTAQLYNLTGKPPLLHNQLGIRSSVHLINRLYKDKFKPSALTAFRWFSSSLYKWDGFTVRV